MPPEYRPRLRFLNPTPRSTRVKGVFVLISTFFIHYIISLNRSLHMHAGTTPWLVLFAFIYVICRLSEIIYYTHKANLDLSYLFWSEEICYVVWGRRWTTFCRRSSETEDLHHICISPKALYQPVLQINKWRSQVSSTNVEAPTSSSTHPKSNISTLSTTSRISSWCVCIISREWGHPTPFTPTKWT